jgi:hypothetical protein
MAQKKPRRIEVLSIKIKFLDETPNEDRVKFEDVLTFMNGKKHNDEFKEYEIKLLNTTLENCIVGIVITKQKKNLPPKINIETGETNPLVFTEKEKLGFGNIFLYNKELSVFFYEVNINGCYSDKLIDFILQEWTSNDENIKFDLSFRVVSRKGEYQRLLDMKHYTEIFVELTQPTEILEDYKDDNSTLFSIIKRYLKDAVKTNSDTMTIKLSAFGKRVNKQGLDRNGALKFIDSARLLLFGTQKKNVKKLTVKGYFTDPDEADTIKPVNLVTDTFNIFIKLRVVTLLTNLQETEKKEEIEKLYIKHLPELKYILNRDS